MKTPALRLAIAIALVALGVAIGLTGVYVGETDDAPGAALLGFVLMAGAFVLARRTARRGR